MSEERFDYVIVGAGSAGCVLANRLSEDGATNVCLLEAGGTNASLLVTMPAGVGDLIKDEGKHNWGLTTAPQKHMEGRRLWTPRGKGLGGSSAINGMIYIRGHALDYDQWRQMGLEGWGYDDVLPYFKRSETYEEGGDAFHGGEGPLHVSLGKSGHPLDKAFMEAAQSAGYSLTEDFNGAQLEGAGTYQLTIKDGERWSVAQGYLRPVAPVRPNLEVKTGASATKILFEGRRAVGVEFARSRGAPPRRVYASKEVLVCLGALHSPQLLMVSGVGPAEQLRAHGLDVVLDQPRVGSNLQDHLDAVVVHRCNQPITGYSYTKGLNKLTVGMSYVFARKGLGRQNFLEAGAFLKSREGLDRPDLQFHLVKAIMIAHGRQQVNEDGYTLHVCQLRPESRGTVSLASKSMFDAPVIDPNYLAAEEDRRAMRQGVRMAREILGQDAFKPYSAGEYVPGAHVGSDEQIDAYIRATGETIYHPVGTVAMGADPGAPLDGELRLRGLEGLRVIDASVMPTLISGNTNAPTVMIAEKAADMIRRRPALARAAA